MTEKEREEIYISAIGTYGIDKQIDMCIEECAELVNALCMLRRGRNNRKDVVTEIADVRIMCGQMALLFGDRDVDEEIERKLERLKERLEASDEQGKDI